MRNQIIVYAFIACASLVSLAGCAIVKPNSPGLVGNSAAGRRWLDTEKLAIGMTFDEVVDLIGDHIVVGYQKNSSGTAFDPINLKNLYRAEFDQNGVDKYSILYYITSIVKSDGIPADEELTPLVFKEDILIGKGWDFLRQQRPAGDAMNDVNTVNGNDLKRPTPRD